MTGFVTGVGGDVIDHDDASTALAALGKTENAMTDDSLLFYGNFVTSTGKFTITADGAGADI